MRQQHPFVLDDRAGLAVRPLEGRLALAHDKGASDFRKARVFFGRFRLISNRPATTALEARKTTRHLDHNGSTEIGTTVPLNDDAIVHLHDSQPYRSNTANPRLTAFLAPRAFSTITSSILPVVPDASWPRNRSILEIDRSMWFALLRSVWVTAPTTSRQLGTKSAIARAGSTPRRGLRARRFRPWLGALASPARRQSTWSLSHENPAPISACESSFERHTPSRAAKRSVISSIDCLKTAMLSLLSYEPPKVRITTVKWYFREVEPADSMKFAFVDFNWLHAIRANHIP